MRRWVTACVILTAMLLPLHAAGEYPDAIDLFGDAAPAAGPLRIETESGVQTSTSHTTPSANTGGGFTLPFEQRASSILVPATVEGRDVYFVFDTGATYTAISTTFAKSAGIMPRPGGPVATFQTANGPVKSPWGVVNNLRFGGRSHHNVTFGACDACPSGSYKGKEIIGLLGLNVIGRYRTSFDHSRGVIEMTPSGAYHNRWRDVEPFIEVAFDQPRIITKSASFLFTGLVKNSSPKTVRELTLECSCDGVTAREKIKIAPGTSTKFSILLTTPRCDQFDRQIVDARW